MDSKINTLTLFKLIFIYWKMLGFFTSYNKYLIGFYDIFVKCVVSLAFPAHLILGAIFAQDEEDLFISGTVSITTTACSIKHFLLRPHLNEILKVNDVLRQLDARVKNEEDIHYYTKYIRKPSIYMTYFFTFIYFGISFLATTTALWSGKLLYPGYVIIDWHSATWKYWLIIIFQAYSLLTQLLQNFTNDFYGPIVMCVLSGHVHLLSRRVSRIGYDASETEVERAYEELVNCIKDYKVLLSTTRRFERIISHSYMVQFISVGTGVVIGLIYLLFYADNFLSYMYYIFYVIALFIELFPCCYYGSMIQAEFYALSYAIFRSNWLIQPRPFRRNVVTFVELTLQDVTIYAGGMMRIHIDSFFKTLKMAYSLFTVVQSMKQ